MDKLKMHSPNLTQDHIARLRELFPGCVTETKGEDGRVKLAVDFDQLRQELAESVVEGPQERYHLNWPGRREALLTANAPIAKTLRPMRTRQEKDGKVVDESVTFDSTRNLFIEGDNLDALKLLQEAYLEKVKFIYRSPIQHRERFHLQGQLCTGNRRIQKGLKSNRFQWSETCFQPRVEWTFSFFLAQHDVFSPQDRKKSTSQ